MSTNYEFKKIGDVDVIESINDFAHVIIEDSGVLKKMAAKNIGAVKTVNGAAPDADGNVQIEVNGGVSSWNNLTDKPFGEETVTLDIHWDGEIGDKPYVSMRGEHFVHVSDCVLNSANAFIGITMTYFEVDGDVKTEQTMTIESGHVMEMHGMIMVGENLIVIPYDNFDFGGLIFPKAGIYFAKFSDMYTSSLVGESTVVNKLDSKYTNNPVVVNITYTYNEETDEYTDVTSDIGYSEIADAYKNGSPVFVCETSDNMFRYPAIILGSEYQEMTGIYLVFAVIYTHNNVSRAIAMMSPMMGGSIQMSTVPASSSLPEVTATDNGKILTVTNGAWTAGEIDEEFIPDTIARVDDVPTVEDILAALPTWTGGSY